MKKYLIMLVVFLTLFLVGVLPVCAADVEVSYPQSNLTYSVSGAVLRVDGSIIFAASATTGEGGGIGVYKINPVTNTITTLCTGGEDGTGEISLRSDGTVIVPTFDNNTTAYMRIIAPNDTVTTKANNDATTTVSVGTGTLFCTDGGDLDFLSSSLQWSDWGHWVHGSGSSIFTSASRSDGKYILAGGSGKWAVYSGSSCLASGTTPAATAIFASAARNDGTFVLVDISGNTYLINSSYAVTLVGNCGISGADSITRFSNDSLLITGQGSSRFLLPNNTFGATVSTGYGAAVALPDNTLIVFNQYSFRHCYFTIDSAPTFSNTSQSGTTISWVQTTPGQYTFRVERSTDGTNFTEIAQTSSTSYTDSGLSPGICYYYRVRISAPNICYSYSPICSVRTIPANPATLNGTGTGLSWSATAGRGKVVLSWPAVTGATGYKVWVFDGSSYRSFDVGNVLSWDSSVAKIYPDEIWLNSQANNSVSTDPFNHVKGGFDLRDDPNKLYLKTIGTTYDNAHNYWFRLSAYNESGESQQSSSAYMPTLPNRTDNSVPTATANVVSDSGLKKTYNQSVKIAVAANDPGAGVYQIMLSNDNVSFTTVFTANKNPDNGTGLSSYSNQFDWTITPGAGTKTVYVKVVDAVNNSTVISDSIAMAEDVIPPSVSLLVNGGASSVTTNNVTLTVLVSDNASVSSQMQMSFSNDGTLWSPWETYSQTKAWDLTTAYGGTSGAGIKKVYVRVYDNAQNIGIASVEVGYNPNPPTNVVTVTSGVPGTYKGKSVIFIGGDMPALNISANGASQMRYDYGVGTWSDWEPYSESKDLVLAKSAGACKVRVQVKDVFGVTSTPQEIMVVIDGEPPVLHGLGTKSGARATSGNTIKLQVNATDNISTSLYYSINGGSKQPLPPDGILTVPIEGSGPVNIIVNIYDEVGNYTSGSISVRKL